jgi:sec-independent protein translocase protein TatC
VLLFEASIVVAIIHDRRKARRRAAEAAAEHLDDDVPSAVDPIPQPLDTTSDPWRETT